MLNYEMISTIHYWSYKITDCEPILGLFQSVSIMTDILHGQQDSKELLSLFGFCGTIQASASQVLLYALELFPLLPPPIPPAPLQCLSPFLLPSLNSTDLWQVTQNMSSTSNENYLNQLTCNLCLKFHTKIKQKKKSKKGLRGNKFTKIHRGLVTIDLPSVSALKQFSFSSNPFSLCILECPLQGVFPRKPVSCLPNSFCLSDAVTWVWKIKRKIQR